MQMKLHEGNGVANDLTRTLVIVLIVERVNALRVIRQGDAAFLARASCTKRSIESSIVGTSSRLARPMNNGGILLGSFWRYVIGEKVLSISGVSVFR
jgi:hypothetical protein